MKWISSLVVAAAYLLPAVLPPPALGLDTVTVSWDQPATAVTAHRIYYSQAPNPFTVVPPVFATVVGNGRSLVLTNVQSGVTFFQATALNGTLESLPTSVVTYTNKSFTPTNLRISFTTNDTVSLIIDGPPNNSVIEHATTVDGPWVADVSIRSLNYTLPVTKAIHVTVASPGEANLYRVRDLTTDSSVSRPISTSRMLPLPTGIPLKANTPVRVRPLKDGP